MKQALSTWTCLQTPLEALVSEAIPMARRLAWESWLQNFNMLPGTVPYCSGSDRVGKCMGQKANSFSLWQHRCCVCSQQRLLKICWCDEIAATINSRRSNSSFHICLTLGWGLLQWKGWCSFSFSVRQISEFGSRHAGHTVPDTRQNNVRLNNAWAHFTKCALWTKTRVSYASGVKALNTFCIMHNMPSICQILDARRGNFYLLCYPMCCCTFSCLCDHKNVLGRHQKFFQVILS